MPNARKARLAITQRDFAILSAVADHRFLTREQVQRLFFGERSAFADRRRVGTAVSGYRAACERLKKLAEASYLKRFLFPRFALDLATDAPPQPGSVRSPFLYTLAPAGAAIVAESRGIASREVLVTKAHELSPFSLAHEVAVNDVRVAISLEVWMAPSWSIVTWQTAQDCLDEYVARDPQTGDWVYRPFAPDAFVHLRLGEQDVACFFEIDRGTESHQSRIVKKVMRYKGYAKSGRFRERYGLPKFRVAFVTTQTMVRAENLRRTVEVHLHEVCWFTTRDQLLATATPLASPIWRLAGGGSELRSFT